MFNDTEKKIDWGYAQHNGPETWSKFYPEAAGKNQSPVDIQQHNLKRVKTENGLKYKYVPENIEKITNSGYGWQVNYNGKDSVLCGGPLEDNFMMEQFHCHWGDNNEEGSEHSIDGKKYPAELHLVHWNTKYYSFHEALKHPDGLCALAMFLKLGEKNEELDKIINFLSKIEYTGQTEIIKVPLNPANFIPQSDYYYYHGSLTSPPCGECVIWIIFKEPIEISADQLNAFRKLRNHRKEEQASEDEFQGFVRKNFRPLMPLGDREIQEYSEH